MTGSRSRYWQDLTTKEFAGIDAERTIAVLPVGAVEQHGPHLPVWVDSAINCGIVERAVPQIPDDLSVLVLPMMPVGIPFQVPFMFLGLLTCTIQALVFTLLSTIYFALMLPHHDHESGHAEGHAAAHH